MKIISIQRSLALSLITMTRVVFAPGVQAKSPNALSTKNPYGADTPIDSPGSNYVVLIVINHFKAVQFILKSLRKLGAAQDSIFEPFVKARKNFTDSQGHLAIVRFGAPIPHDQDGPIRIIYPDRSVSGENINAWNWSLSAIGVK